MKLDRDLQRKVLEACASIYPKPADPTRLAVACEADEDAFTANVAYLAEHGLVDCEVRRLGGEVALTVCTITARGLDFLADDGGLTAILGTVTVKLHADTIREMLIARVESSSEPAEEEPFAQADRGAARRGPAGLGHACCTGRPDARS